MYGSFAFNETIFIGNGITEWLRIIKPDCLGSNPELIS